MIEVQNVKPTYRELRTAWRLRRGWASYAVGLIGVIPLIGLLAMFIIASRTTYEDDIWILTITFVVAAIAPTLAGTFLMPFLSRAAGYPAEQQSFNWQISAEGIATIGPLSSGRISWPGIRNVLEQKDRFVFLVAPLHSPVLPKRQMTAEQIDALRALIAEVRASGRLGRGVD